MAQGGNGFPFTPTDEQRAVVRALAEILPQKEIAKRIIDPIERRSIDPKTLRKYFAQELADGKAGSNAEVRSTLYKMATSGRHIVATIFWCKTQMGYKEPRDAAIDGATYGELVAAAASEAAKLLEAKKNAPAPVLELVKKAAP